MKSCILCTRLVSSFEMSLVFLAWTVDTFAGSQVVKRCLSEVIKICCCTVSARHGRNRPLVVTCCLFLAWRMSSRTHRRSQVAGVKLPPSRMCWTEISVMRWASTISPRVLDGMLSIWESFVVAGATGGCLFFVSCSAFAFSAHNRYSLRTGNTASLP